MFGAFKKDREKEKDEVVSALENRITNNHLNFDDLEQVEILNRLTIRIFERKKDKRNRLVEEARMAQNSMKEIKV